jgi:hypothetical protein
MEEHLYVVIHRVDSNSQWRVDEAFNELRLAENLAEIKRLLDTSPKYEYRIVSGVILPLPETEAEAEARLGPFEAVAVPPPSDEPQTWDGACAEASGYPQF